MPAAAIPVVWGTIIGAGAQAAASAYSAHQQSSAARNAAELQARGNAEALAESRRSEQAALAEQRGQRDYDRESARLAREDALTRQQPYIDMGNAAASRYADRLGLPGMTFGSLTSGTGAAPLAPPPSSRSGITMPTGAPGTGTMGGLQTAAAAPSMNFGDLMGGSPMAPPAAPSAAPSMTGGIADVRMVAPDGWTGLVPYNRVAEAERDGLRRA